MTHAQNISASDFAEVRPARWAAGRYEVSTRGYPGDHVWAGIGMTLSNKIDAERVAAILGAQRLYDYKREFGDRGEQQ